MFPTITELPPHPPHLKPLFLLCSSHLPTLEELPIVSSPIDEDEAIQSGARLILASLWTHIILITTRNQPN